MLTHFRKSEVEVVSHFQIPYVKKIFIEIQILLVANSQTFTNLRESIEMDTENQNLLAFKSVSLIDQPELIRKIKFCLFIT